MENSYEAQCELAYKLNFHPLYRFSLFYVAVVSIIACPSLAYFILAKMVNSKFHGNLKCLLNSYFTSIFLFSLMLGLGFGWRAAATFFVKDMCDLLIDSLLFKIYHLSSLIVMTSSMLLPGGFSIERFVALYLAEKYEHVRTLLGPILLIALIGFDFLVVFIIYHNETFAGPHIAIILVPATSAYQFNLFFYFLFGILIFNLISNCILLKLHSRIKSRYLKRSKTLSLRYEMEEIDQSSKFTLVVSFTHLIFTSSYVILGILSRVYGPTFFESELNYTVARAVYCSVPTYNLVIVFLGSWALHHLNVKRKNTVNVTIQMKSTGQEGIQNYQDLIYRQWA